MQTFFYKLLISEGFEKVILWLMLLHTPKDMSTLGMAALCMSTIVFPSLPQLTLRLVRALFHRDRYLTHI